MGRPGRALVSHRLMASVGVLALAAACGGHAFADPLALPSGGAVVAGSAAITQTGPASTLVVQQGRKAVINWRDFSIGSGASVTFQQPDASAITLNRVTGGGASVINGNLLANGQVWLVNGNGVLFGQGSRIDVGGLIATTSDIKDADFLSGNYAFSGASPNPDAAVVNRGSIKAATGGSAVLSAPHVANEGVIQARLGRVVLGGASAFTVGFDGDNLLSYQVSRPVSETPKDKDGKPVSALVSNSGTIAAEGGSVLMTARAARNVVDNVINQAGIIQANSVSVHNGEVVLDAGDGGAASIAGTVDVSGKNAGETGGAITLSGEKVAVVDGARLDASGTAGGGSVLVGGDPVNPAATKAQAVTVGKAAIAADATGSGMGGRVAIISSGTTRVAASISAKGVSAGGTVETSGHDLQIQNGITVDTSAPGGAGLWLLDPVDVDVDAAAAGNILTSIASTNVTVTASNDITVDAPLVYNSANSLAFLAGHNITFNANVQNGGSGAITAVAGATAASAVLTTPGSYGNNGGSVLIGGAAAGPVAVGSKTGTTLVLAQDLSLLAINGYAQLGYHGDSTHSVDTSGAIVVGLTGNLVLSGGNGSLAPAFAQIGHGGHESGGNQTGAITVSAAGSVALAGGTSFRSYAQIGNGATTGKGTSSGNVLLAAGGDITLGAGSLIRASAAGDAAVVAAGGNFVNQAGVGAMDVSSGRWLIFLDDPANNMPGGLSAAPFYNRAFDFVADSYAPVASSGNRFVYRLAPVVTVTAADQTKVYGNANPVLTATVAGGLPGDAAAGVFSGAPSLSTAATARSSVGDYAIAAGLGSLTSDFNYGFQFVSGTLHINPALVTAALTGTVQKVYDGTAAATLTSANYQLTGVLAGDAVTLSGAAAYDSKTVGSGKLVSASGLNLQGADAGNYVLAAPSLSAAIGIITPATVTASLIGTVTKTYDGTTAATLAAGNYQLNGAVAADAVSVSSPVAGSYNSKDVGSGKLVSVSGLQLQGADAGNYVLAVPNLSAAIGTITPATVTASLIGTVTKTYDGTTAATLTAGNYLLTGAVAADAVSLSSPVAGSYNSKDAGSAKLVGVSGLQLQGADAGNYVLAASSLSAAIGTITPATVTASLAGAVSKTYDGTTAATLTAGNYQLTGALAGDTVSLSPAAGSYDSKDVGTAKLVSVSGLQLQGADAGNYVLVTTSLSASVGSITPATLSASLTGSVSKRYDGTVSAVLDGSNYILSGVIGGDNVGLNNPVSGVYDTSVAGIGKTVTVSGLALLGPDAGNYVLASPAASGTVGIITAPQISDLLGNSYLNTGNPFLNRPAPGGGALPAPSEATGAIGEGTDSAAAQIGQSLSGAAQSSSTVLIEGLLRQFSASSGGVPRGVPPYGQVYSSWGNEALWQ